MHDIRDGKLEIRFISRVEYVCLGIRHLICPERHWDSFAIHLSGECDYHFQDGTDIRVKKGSLIYLPYGAVYTMDILTPNFSYIVCDGRVDRESVRQYFCYDTKNPEVYEKLFQKLRQTYHSVAADSRPEAMSILFQIYAQIVRDSHPSYLSSTSRAVVERMASYVHNHIYDPNLSVDKLVYLSELSETHFRRLFQQVYGMTPSKYIMYARIKQAKSLMDMQELTLQDISVQCGFSSYTYFCTAFKAATGQNPSIYRQKFYPAACRKQEPV